MNTARIGVPSEIKDLTYQENKEIEMNKKLSSQKEEIKKLKQKIIDLLQGHN